MRSILLMPLTVFYVISAVDSAAVLRKKGRSVDGLETPQTRKSREGTPATESIDLYVESTALHEGTSKRNHAKNRKLNQQNRSKFEYQESLQEENSGELELGEPSEEEEQSSLTKHHKKMSSLDDTDPQMARQLRIEMIKQQILNKLRLDAPPNITRGRTQLPEPLFSERSLGMQSDQPPPPVEREDNYYAKLTEVIIFSEEVNNCERKEGSACFRFPLRADVHDKTISSAQFYFYRAASPNDEDDQTLQLMQLAHQSVKIIGEVRTSKRDGWVQMEIKETVARWLIHDVDNRELMLYCKTCQSQKSPISLTGSKRPFLFIKTDTQSSGRRTRSINCRSGIHQCCRQDFYVSFAEIGWDDWIIEPSGYWANFCKGGCAIGTSPLSAHTSLMYRFVEKEKDKEYRDLLTPCCVPSEYSSQSILYHDNSDTELLYRREISDLVVQSCRCA